MELLIKLVVVGMQKRLDPRNLKAGLKGQMN